MSHTFLQIKNQKETKDRHLNRGQRSYAVDEGELTDGGEDAGEAEVVDGVKREQMEKKLLLLLLAAQEGIALVKLPAVRG